MSNTRKLSAAERRRRAIEFYAAHATRNGVRPTDLARQNAVVKAECAKADLTEALCETNGNVKEALRRTGISRYRARKLLPEVYERMLDALSEAGATPQKVARVVSDALEAERPIVVKGEQVGSRPDHGTQLSAAKLWVSMTGAKAPDRHINANLNVPGTAGHITAENVLARFERLREFEPVLKEIAATQEG